MVINLISSKDLDEIHNICTKSNYIEIMTGNETDEIIRELEKKMKGSEFAFDNVDLLHHKLHKISLNGGESHIGSAEWKKNKKATINAKKMMIVLSICSNCCIELPKHQKQFKENTKN